MSNEVTIITNGQAISGWTSIQITRTMSSIADSFRISFLDSWVKQFPDVYAGLGCSIKIDGVKIITGYIDSITPELSANEVKFELSGRSKTGDLVDCDRIQAPFSWKDIDIYRLSREVCEPFGISVLLDNVLPGNRFDEISYEQGETVFSFLSKLAEQRGYILISNTTGDLVYTTAGNTRAEDSIIQGQNLASIKANFSLVNRFSNYVIKGQSIKKNNNAWTDSNVSIKAETTDEQISRYRSKLITADTKITTSSAQKKVNWEAQIRAGRSFKFTIVIPTWLQSNGDLWKENLLTYVKSPLFRIDGDYLLETVTYVLEPNDIYSELTFVDPVTYQPEPKAIIKKSPKSQRKVGKYGWIG